MNYNYCKCKEVQETYISYAKNICCSECFSIIENYGVRIFKASIKLIEDEHNYTIRNHGVVVKSFNKFGDDYAATNSKMLVRHLMHK